MAETILSERDKCPKCGGNTLERDSEGDIHCWGCGTTFVDGEIVLSKSMLEEAKQMVNPYERHRYYEKNKAAILEDYKNLGEAATRKKWNIPRGATLPNLLKRWQGETPFQATTDNHALPAFPEFSITWPPEVQLKWLEIYEKLLDKHSSENMNRR